MRRLLLPVLLCMAIFSPVFAGHSDLEESYTEILQGVEKQAVHAYVGGLDSLEKQMIAADRPREVLDVRNEKQRFERDGDIAIGLTRQRRAIVALAQSVLAARRERQEALNEAYIHLLEMRVKELTRQSRLKEASAAAERLKTIRARLSEAKSVTTVSPPKSTLPEGSSGPAPGLGDKIEIADLGLTLLPVQPGSFLMGSPDAGSPLHVQRHASERQFEVTITRPYWLGRTEVTQAQYEAIMGTNPSQFKGKDLPVEQVTWHDAVEFCQKLTERERAAGRLPAGQVYRLPTEAEWEYACRAGTTTAFHYGDSLSSVQANFNGDAPYGGAARGPALGRTTDIASYKPNAWGFYDMHGNVWEWCSDWYAGYPQEPVTDPTGAERGSRRVLRGGGWQSDGWDCRAASRNRGIRGLADHRQGFRIVLGPVLP